MIRLVLGFNFYDFQCFDFSKKEEARVTLRLQSGMNEYLMPLPFGSGHSATSHDGRPFCCPILPARTQRSLQYPQQVWMSIFPTIIQCLDVKFIYFFKNLIWTMDYIAWQTIPRCLMFASMVGRNKHPFNFILFYTEFCLSSILSTLWTFGQDFQLVFTHDL